MRNLIMAVIVAVSGITTFGATAQADTKVIIRDDHPRPMHRRVVERRMVERDHDRRCMTKKVVTRAHGERVVRVTKVCR